MFAAKKGEIRKRSKMRAVHTAARTAVVRFHIFHMCSATTLMKLYPLRLMLLIQSKENLKNELFDIYLMVPIFVNLDNKLLVPTF